MDHPKRPASVGQPQKPPEFQFRGAWLPAPVLQSLMQHLISPNEMMLLVIVDAFVRSGGPGCFATNKYLAEILGIKRQSLKKMNAKLVKLGALITTIRDGQRYMETSWSRAGEGGVSVRDTPPVSVRDTPPVSVRDTQKEAKEEEEVGKRRPLRGRPRPVVPEDDSMDELVEDREVLASPQDRNRVTPSKEDIGFARKLKEHVCAHHQYKTWSSRRWADSFRLLRVEKNLPASTVEQVLDWYIQNKPTRPTVIDGKQFRQHFDWIRRLMDAPRPVEVTEEAQKIVARLTRRYVWPKGSADQLPQVVQQSINNYEDWIAQVKELGRDKYHSVGTIEQFARKLVVTCPRIHDFVLDWFRQFHEQCVGWEGWSGKLTPFKPDSVAFRAMGRAWAERFGNANLWDQLMKECYK